MLLRSDSADGKYEQTDLYIKMGVLLIVLIFDTLLFHIKLLLFIFVYIKIKYVIVRFMTFTQMYIYILPIYGYYFLIVFVHFDKYQGTWVLTDIYYVLLVL